jgi:hypothetical protein
MSPRSGSHLQGRISGSNGRVERALAPGCAEDCGEAFGPYTRGASRAHAGPLGREGSSRGWRNSVPGSWRFYLQQRQGAVIAETGWLSGPRLRCGG